jgi:ADP-dependent NAD(P)H-hydrate dehydratase / NAD(P)H-hydrate epimerase
VRPVLAPEEMSESDRRTIEAGTPQDVLMERAGHAVARAVRRTSGGAYGARALIVCGKGNNGGDGLVAARLLTEWGVRVDVMKLSEGIDRASFTRALGRQPVFVDAMFGTGFQGKLDEDAAWVATAVSGSGVKVVAVDIPSGVDGRTGAVVADAVRADVTVTFAALKPGLVCEPGRSYAGHVEIVDIGIELAVEAGAAALGETEATDVAAWLPRRKVDTHKWAVGGVMVVGGSGGMIGAPTLVSHAALRAGAGIVWCGLPGTDAAGRASGTEVITKALPETPDGSLDESAAGVVLQGLDRFGALVVGPGLGGDPHTGRAVADLVAAAPVPLVLDADGLNALHGDLGPLHKRHSAQGEATVLTPHAAEFERLFGRPVGDDRVESARIAAQDSNSVVLLKGATTVIAAPDGRAALNPTGSPWLATAGTGDVLSGIVAAFIARGVPAFEAAVAAAWVHGRAVDFVEPAGPTGMIASDLVEAIPRTLVALDRGELREA